MTRYIVKLLILSILLVGCEDVVDVDLQDAPPKLVVEALINWEKGTTGNEQTISLRQTTPFFEQGVVNATGATVTIAHENGTVFPFAETAPGTYTTDSFIPEIGTTYTLTILYQNETFRAIETMIGVNPIKRVEQRVSILGGEEANEVVFYYDDPEEEENYYLVNLLPDFQERKSFDFYPDTFINGNEIEDFYSSDYEDPESEDEIREYRTGDVFDIQLFGISERFYNYFSIIVEQANAESGPFSIAPATAKGNCVNVTNPDNFPFGYFRLSELDRRTYTYE